MRRDRVGVLKPCVFVETVGNRLATVLETVYVSVETVGNREIKVKHSLF